jgi:hypothetical protein
MPGPVVTPLRLYAGKLTRADYEALLKRFDDRPVSLSLIVAAAIFAGLGWGALDPDLYGELALLPVIAAAAAVFYGLAQLWRRVRRARRLARWTQPEQPLEVSVYPYHLSVREDGRTRNYAWDDIFAITFDEDRVFLTKSRDDVVIVPLCAFESRKAMRDFVLQCEDLMREADERGGQTSDCSPVAAQSSVSTQPHASALPALAADARDAVDVTLTAEDTRNVEAGLRPTGVAAPVPLSIAALTMGIAGAMIFGGPVWLIATGSSDAKLLAGSVAALLGALLLTFLGARRIESARAAQWPADDPRRMARRFEIDEAGFVTRGAEFETRIAWVGVESIRETEQHILFITRWKEVYAVPKRCFPNADAGLAFVLKARAYKTAS